MKSTATPHVATGVTAEALVITFGLTGGLKHEVTVPSGTRCKKLNGGSSPWVVDDLSFIEDKRSIMYHDADHYGIRVPEDKLTDVKPVRQL